jgi:DNA processing protein
LKRHAHLLPFPLSELPERWAAVEARTQSVGGRAISWKESEYPANLEQLTDAPSLLFVRGQTAAWKQPLIAVVGTRRCSDAAARWAYRAGAHIAECGATLVSGLAMGIDVAAMRGAYEAGGAVVACLGHGLERIHPKGHRALAEALLERGAWVTEYPVDTHVDRWHFAHRNRIVAGLASATMLVQSPANGGGMITARLALDANRDLLVLRPFDGHPDWGGNRYWLDEGATEVRSFEDILSGTRAVCDVPQLPSPPSGLSRVWQALKGSGGCSVETIATNAAISESQARRQLLVLELGGWVRRSPGGWFFPSEPADA